MTGRKRPVVKRREGSNLFCWQCPVCGEISVEYLGIPDAAFSATLHRCRISLRWLTVTA